MRQFKFCYEKKESKNLERNGQGTCWRGVPLKLGETVVARNEVEAAALESHPLFVEITPASERKGK